MQPLDEVAQVVSELLMAVTADIAADTMLRFGSRRPAFFKREDGPLPKDLVVETVEDAVRSLLDVERIAAWLGGEELRAVLNSPEFHQLGRQALAIELVDASERAQLSEVVAAVGELLAMRTSLAHDDRLVAAQHLLAAVRMSGMARLQVAVGEGKLAAKDLRDAGRYSAIRAELAAIKPMLEQLTISTRAQVESYVAWEERYRRAFCREQRSWSLRTLTVVRSPSRSDSCMSSRWCLRRLPCGRFQTS